MIRFKDWTITSDGFLARQYDNLSRRVEVIGDLPEGWLWDLLVQVGDAMDILPLEPMEGGVGHTLTADQVSIDGYYTVQLRGRMGEVVRHTNTTQTFVSKTLSGTGTWPTLPSEYSMVVTINENDSGEMFASHSAGEIIVQMERGWDVSLNFDVTLGNEKVGIHLAPLGYQVSKDGTDHLIRGVMFGAQLMVDGGFMSLAFTVLDYVDLVDNSDTILGVAQPMEAMGNSIVTSVNGKTGEVWLTASDVNAPSRSELNSAINAALVQAKASGEFDGAPGPAGAPGKDNLPNVEAVAGSTVSLTLSNNVEYHCTDAVTALTIQGFTPADDGKVSMWALQFAAGSTITVTIPDSVRWAIAEPVFTPGVRYWLSFVPLVSGEVLGVWVSDE